MGIARAKELERERAVATEDREKTTADAEAAANEALDTDQDGIPDHLDKDDDNDGIPDHLDINPKQKDLVKDRGLLFARAAVIKAMPDGPAKEAAKAKLIEAAKTLENAVDEVDNVEELKRKEKALLLTARSVRDMPSGVEKELRKQMLLSKAKRLTAKRAAAT